MDFPALRSLRRREPAIAVLREARFQFPHAGTVVRDRSQLMVFISHSTSTPTAESSRRDLQTFVGKGLVQHVSLAVAARSGAMRIHADVTRQRGYLAGGWGSPVKQRTSEKFIRRREYLGRVRRVDVESGTFAAILGDRPDDPERELLATFDLALLDSKQLSRVGRGTVFTLVTGFRKTVDDSGRVIKTGLDTRLFLHRPRSLSDSRREAVRKWADMLYDEE